MNVLAASRPEFALLLHIAGASILVGAVTAAAGTLVFTPGGGGDPAGLRRFAFRVLLLVAIPAYIVMRIGAEWLYSAEEIEDLPGDDPGWIAIGYITADLGLLVLLIATVCAGLASRRSSAGLGKAAGILTAILIVAWVIAVWAMGGKPD